MQKPELFINQGLGSIVNKINALVKYFMLHVNLSVKNKSPNNINFW